MPEAKLHIVGYFELHSLPRYNVSRKSTIAIMAGKFEPKTPVQLNPPKDDLISVERLSECNGA